MSTTRQGNLVVLTAPSGAGKSTLVSLLLERLQDLVFSVSYTTRPPRPQEQHGKDYVFVDEAEFSQRVAQDLFLEWARVHDHHYGTAADAVDEQLSAGRDVLLDIDVQGANQVVRKRPETVTIFLLPPSFDELRRRLVNRGTEGEETVRKRLERARGEVQHCRKFQYVVVNHTIEQSFDELRAIILAERATRHCRQNEVDAIIATFVEKPETEGGND